MIIIMIMLIMILILMIILTLRYTIIPMMIRSPMLPPIIAARPLNTTLFLTPSEKPY